MGRIREILYLYSLIQVILNLFLKGIQISI